jgi:uncharacterized protein YcbX
MTKEALKLALEALEADPAEMVEDENGHMVFRRIQAIITLREALANEALDKMAKNARELGLDYEPAQRTWVEIDDEDFSKALELCDFDKIAAFEFFEAKLKEKNNG